MQTEISFLLAGKPFKVSWRSGWFQSIIVLVQHYIAQCADWAVRWPCGIKSGHAVLKRKGPFSHLYSWEKVTFTYSIIYNLHRKILTRPLCWENDVTRIPMVTSRVVPSLQRRLSSSTSYQHFQIYQTLVVGGCTDLPKWHFFMFYSKFLCYGQL